MSILYSHNLEDRTKKIQDTERFMVRVNGGGIKTIELRQKQIQKERDIILNDLQIKLYELMIRESTLSKIYDEITGDTK